MKFRMLFKRIDFTSLCLLVTYNYFSFPGLIKKHTYLKLFEIFWLLILLVTFQGLFFVFEVPSEWLQVFSWWYSRKLEAVRYPLETKCNVLLKGKRCSLWHFSHIKFKALLLIFKKSHVFSEKVISELISWINIAH